MLEVDVGPAQAEQFALAGTGEERGDPAGGFAVGAGVDRGAQDVLGDVDG